jgi:L-aminopeptidase/D-esterase-like protein
MTGTIVDVPGVRVGHAEDKEALTGCSVVLLDQASVCGVDVRGSAPGTRETDLLNPINTVDVVHAICLTGGSAYGLDAAAGVMQWLEEQGRGLDVGFGLVPIVPAAVLFDLPLGDGRVRPDRRMGYQACLNATDQAVPMGNAGAGLGAAVGKMNGFSSAMKGGLGSASRKLPNGLVVGAIVAVNALGHVIDPQTMEILAGPRNEQGQILDSVELMIRQYHPLIPPGSNTTIAVVASNARLTKSQATKVAQMAHDGLARTIRPVHTTADGDTVFAVATGEMEAAVDLIGTLSADVLAEAVVQAVKQATAAGGLPAWRDLAR